MHSTTRVIHRREIAHNTLEFIFQKPDDLQFRAGQHINIKLPQLYFDDPRGWRRTFTIASSPHEEDIVITSRLSNSGYKKTLAEMPYGTNVEIYGPRGSFYLPEEPGRVVFIAGGIGITPFRSMLLDSLEKSSGHHITLLYSNRLRREAAYHEVFSRLACEHKSFTYRPTLTAKTLEGEEWKGERRMIDYSFVRDYIPDLGSTDIYLCGPPAMVEALLEILEAHDVHESSIHYESFFGY